MYEIYFGTEMFPIAPSAIKTQIDNKNKTIELMNEGEVNVLRNAGLTSFSFELLLPNVKYPFAVYLNGFKPAKYYITILEVLKENKKPFPLTISRVNPKGEVIDYTQKQVSIEEYSLTESVDNGLDVVASIELKEYKAYGTKTYPLPETSTKKEVKKERPAGKGSENVGKEYVIQSGDTLWSIAKKMYGDGSKWGAIFTANKKILDEAAKKHGKADSGNGHWIYTGTKITIPDASKTSTSKNSVDYNQGGSKSNPPFAILSANSNVVKARIQTWNEAYGYYMANSGKTKGWKIVDKSNKVITL